MSQLLKSLPVYALKNIILIGSGSIIAQYFYSRYRNNDEIKLLCISRKNNGAILNSNHILHDFSLPFNIHSHNIIVSQIRAILDLSCETSLCLFAWSGTPRTSLDPQLSEFIKADNSNIVNNLSFLIKDLDLTQIIFLSSAGGIYDNDNESLHNEMSIPCPATPYGLQKLKAESMLGFIATKLKVPLCIYRVTCAYGFNKFCPDQGVLNKWIFDGLLHGKINLYNSLDSELNFISYDQISYAMDVAINLRLCGIFNLGTSSSTSLRTIYNLVIRQIPNISVNILGDKRRYLNVDCTRLTSLSGHEIESNIELDSRSIFNTIALSIDQT